VANCGGNAGGHGVAVGAVAVGGVMMRCGVAIAGAFAVDGVIVRCGYAVRGDAIVGGGMIVAVDYDVAQELANLIGADCRAKYGSAPDNVVVDGQSYVPVLSPGS
jgi:hypothetical protein